MGKGENGLGWFHEITRNPYIDVALLVDNTGRLIATTNRIGSAAKRVAAMIKAAEVLASGLAQAWGQGEMDSLQLSTQLGHVLVIPASKVHYLIVLTSYEAPMDSICDEMRHLIAHMPEDEIAAALRPPSDLDGLNVQELIDAVSNWLQQGGDSDTSLG